MPHLGMVSPTKAPLTMLRFPHRAPLTPCGFSSTPCTLLRTTDHGTFFVVILISEQVVPYQTCGGTCCPGGVYF
jgi:hypothetical protein